MNDVNNSVHLETKMFARTIGTPEGLTLWSRKNLLLAANLSHKRPITLNPILSSLDTPSQNGLKELVTGQRTTGELSVWKLECAEQTSDHEHKHGTCRRRGRLCAPAE